MDLSKLNEKQKESVLCVKGPLLILAGPGSGKTRVLTLKIAYLIKEGYASPSEILAITFTNKASKEMKERVYSLVGNDVYSIQISTFHSFGLRILKENYKEVGLEKSFTILDEADSISVIKHILKDMNLDIKQYNPKNIKYRISSAKNELILPKEFSRYSKGDIEENISKIYQKYQERLSKTSSVDFDDLLMMPILLFKNNPDILKKYQEKFKYVFIDEYQDTNEAQYIMSKLISAKYKNICVVGDESQNVYSWRGANYKNILNFEKDYLNSNTILLEQNYRSTKTIINAANDVIKNNKDRKDKNLWTDNDEGIKIKYLRTSDEKDECYNIISEIKRYNKEGHSYNDMVVLYRTNAQSQIVERTFLESGIPYKIVGSYAYYNRKEIKDLVSYLKLIYNTKDDVSLSRIINVPRRGIGEKSIDNLSIKATKEDKSIFEIIDSGKELEFKKLIIELQDYSTKLSLTDLVDVILDKTGMKDEYVKEDTPEADSKLDNLEEFKSITKGFEEATGLVSLEEFLMEISLVSDVNENKDNEERVTLMTTHSAKGLEFSIVFVIGLEEGIFPHNNSLMDNKDLEEERRLFYVAITRTKTILYLLNARTRMLFGRTTINMPSRFIEEINSDLIESNFKKETKVLKIKNNFNDEEVDLNIGDHINHDLFGPGIIVSLDKIFVTIAFSQKTGIKKLLKNHKAIKKV